MAPKAKKKNNWGLSVDEIDYTEDAVEDGRIILRIIESFQFNDIQQREFQISVEPRMDKTSHISFIET